MIDRFERQDDFVPRERLADLTVTVVGAGAIGRQVALQLAAIGVRRLQLVDFDTVEPTNITTQGYFTDDVGLPKVQATKIAAHCLAPDVAIETICDRFRSKHEHGECLFCCVDSISSREAIWRGVQHGCRFWADGRMLGEVIRILTVADEQGREHYPTTLFDQSQAQVGRCTGHGTIYAAHVASGLLVHQFTRWLRRLPIDRDVTLNLLAGELTVA
jgi:molybdopterin/thiamine biosynthesis adenylyltransferase